MRQFIKFAIVGFSSTIIDWGIYLILTRFLGIYYLMAKILSFSIAMINSYIWNRRWTFKSNDPQKLREFIKFLIIALVGVVLNTLIMYVAVDFIYLNDLYGLVFASGIVMFWNFGANKFYTFKESQT